MEDGGISSRPSAEVILQRKISSGNEVFSSLQTKLRNCESGVPKVVAFFEELVAMSTNKDREKRKKVKFATFLEMLSSELALTFDETEASYCKKRFCYLDDLDVNKLYAALDIGRPDTHTDPDYFADKLPQPYRLVSKIIEMEILDNAWLEITRIHPEYLLGSDGKPIHVPKSQRMQYVNKPVGEKAIEFVSMRASPVGNFVFGTTANGEFIALDSSSDQVASSIQAIGGDIACSPPMLSPLKIISISEPTKKKRIIRVLLLCKSQIEEVKKVEEPVVDPKAKSKKPPVVEEPKVEMKSIVLMTVVEVSVAARKKGQGPPMQLVARAKVELPAADSIDIIGADIALDGSLLVACTSAGFTLFQLTDMKKSQVERAAASVTTGPIDEETKEGASPRPAAPMEFTLPVLFFDEYIAENEKEASPSASMACRSSFLVEIEEEDDNIPKCVHGLFNMEGLREEDVYPPQVRLCRFSLILLFDSCHYWRTFTFLKTPELDEEGEGDDALVACTSWEDATYTYTVKHRQRHDHASPVTASGFSEGNILLTMGHQDGTVSLFQAVDKAAIGCPNRHACPVTSTCIAYNPHSKHYSLISGALDGSLIFTHLEVAVPIVYETWGYAPRPVLPPMEEFLEAAEKGDGLAFVGPCVDFRCHPIDTREDVPGAYVSSIHHIRESPVAVVHYSNGVIVAYDMETGNVLGKLVLYYGSKAKEFSFRPLVTGDALDIFERKIPLPSQRPAPSIPSQKYVIANDENDGDENDGDEKGRNDGDENNGDKKAIIAIHPESINNTNDFKLLTATPPGKFMCSFLRNGTAVLVTFSLESIVRELCPGVAALARSRPEPYPLKDLLKHLTGSQRADAELTVAAVPALLALLKAEGSVAGNSNPGTRGSGSAHSSNPSSRKSSASQVPSAAAAADSANRSTTGSAAGSRKGTAGGTRPPTGASSKPPWVTQLATPDPSVLSTAVDPDMEYIFRTPVRSIIWEDKLDMRRITWTLEQEMEQNADAREKSFMPFMKEMQRQAEEMEGKEALAKKLAEATAELSK